MPEKKTVSKELGQCEKHPRQPLPCPECKVAEDS